MISKKQNRSLFVIEVYSQSQLLGFYSGKDDENNVIYGKLNKASTIKTDKAAEHILKHLVKYDGDRYSFSIRKAFEVRKTIYCDEYEQEEWEGQRGIHSVIRVKQKSDMLLEPAYLSAYDNATGAFKSSSRVSKAVLYAKKSATNICKALTLLYNENYIFNQEQIFIKEERTIELLL